MKTRHWTLMAMATLLTACGGGGGGGGTAAPAPSDVGVTVTSGKAIAGKHVTFQAVLTNTGPNAANQVSMSSTLTAGYQADSITCTASGGATCPATTGATLTIATLPVNGSLSFAIAVPLAAGSTGNVSATVTTSTAGDTSATNDSATSSATVAAADSRSGTYQLYSTNGQNYALAIDFDDLTYTVDGNGFTKSATLLASADGSTFQFTDTQAAQGSTLAAGTSFTSNAQLRTATDLVIGGFDFGGGVMPFIAARKFVTDLSQLSGDYDNFQINYSTSGAGDSRIYTSGFSGATMNNCQDNIIYTIENCPSSSVWSYALTIQGADITGVDSVHNDTTELRVVISGQTRFILRASTALNGTGKRFRLGLPNTAGLAGGSFHGVTTLGALESAVVANDVDTVTLTSPTQQASTETIVLNNIQPGPTGIFGGQRSADNAPFFVMQAGPILARVGARTPNVTGFMSIGTP